MRCELKLDKLKLLTCNNSLSSDPSVLEEHTKEEAQFPDQLSDWENHLSCRGILNCLNPVALGTEPSPVSQIYPR